MMKVLEKSEVKIEAFYGEDTVRHVITQNGELLYDCTSSIRKYANSGSMLRQFELWLMDEKTDIRRPIFNIDSLIPKLEITIQPCDNGNCQGLSVEHANRISNQVRESVSEAFLTALSNILK